ncbi:hypothetical protein CRU95_15260 [Arcobacter sp. F2176]|nr:hypothetical protein CRU95_15260 [Arcobacter sp. F2176]
MNFILKVIVVVISIRTLIKGIDLVINSDAKYYLRGVCVTCQSQLYTIILGCVLILISLLFFYLVLKNKIRI